MIYAGIAGTGQYVPERVLENAELVRMLAEKFPGNPDRQTSDEWIVRRTGIRQRRIAQPDETNATMGALALKNALADAKINASELELIIAATNSSRKRFPSCAGQIQSAIGAPESCGFFDIQAGCTGFSYGLAIANALIQTGMHKNIAVIGTDKLSEITDYDDRNTCTLFGDLACAWILKPGQQPGILNSLMYGRGKDCGLITLTDDKDKLTMDGGAVFRFAAEVIPQICMKVLDGTTYTLRGVNKIFPHNANVRIIDYAAEKLSRDTGIPLDEMKAKFYHTTEKYGNASAGSNANSFHEARKDGVVKRGDVCMLVGFGAGLTYGANLFIL